MRRRSDGRVGVYRSRSSAAADRYGRYAMILRGCSVTLLSMILIISGILGDRPVAEIPMSIIALVVSFAVVAVICFIAAEVVLESRHLKLRREAWDLYSGGLHIVVRERWFRWLPWPWIAPPQRAACTCGWRGFWRLRHGVACADGDRHITLVEQR